MKPVGFNITGLSYDNSYIFWQGADPYKILKVMPDFGFYTLNSFSDSASESYNRICYNDQCVYNLKKTSETSSFDGPLFEGFTYDNYTDPI